MLPPSRPNFSSALGLYSEGTIFEFQPVAALLSCPLAFWFLSNLRTITLWKVAVTLSLYHLQRDRSDRLLRYTILSRQHWQNFTYSYF